VSTKGIVTASRGKTRELTCYVGLDTDDEATVFTAFLGSSQILKNADDEYRSGTPIVASVVDVKAFLKANGSEKAFREAVKDHRAAEAEQARREEERREQAAAARAEAERQKLIEAKKLELAKQRAREVEDQIAAQAAELVDADLATSGK
jgi:hypothetical protein